MKLARRPLTDVMQYVGSLSKDGDTQVVQGDESNSKS